MDLKTKYMGLELKNPVAASASPLTQDLDSAKKLEDAGVSALVVHSLFEEQLSHESGELDHYLSAGTDSFAEATSYFPAQEDFKLGPVEYLDHIANLKKSLEIPVIGSLNGVSKGGWVNYAKNIQDAGADALELNVYYVPTDPMMDAAKVEDMYVETLKAVKANVTIPVAIKIGPFFTAMANMAKKLDEAGADGLVLFNRFYQPDFDLDKLEVVPNLLLSSKYEMRLPLRWIAILFDKVKASLAATRGIQDAEDVIKLMMAGGDVAMIASEFLRNGPGKATEIINGMTAWMEAKEYESVTQMKGSMSQKSVGEPAAFERANYMKTLQSYKAVK
ncbi:MAG: dihydroorotate dehydrogenase-like protein [Bacteroidetes bacterium]|nr:dihydroorotate dehydrogenase-like protein [Bacteroidota bacterium]